MKFHRFMVKGSRLKYNLNDYKVMKIIDTTLLDKVSALAKESERLRMNYNFHQSLEDKCHRFLNAVEPLCPEEGLFGVDIPKNVWHNVECLESGSVFFECKEGPFVPHEVEGILSVKR